MLLSKNVDFCPYCTFMQAGGISSLVKYRLRRCEVMAYAIVKFCAFAQSEVKFAHFAEGETSLSVGQLHYRRLLHLPARANLVSKNKSTAKAVLLFLEVPPRFELGNEGFADLCLTAWPRHHIFKKERLAFLSVCLERVTRLELATSTLARWRSTG